MFINSFIDEIQYTGKNISTNCKFFWKISSSASGAKESYINA